MKRRIFTLPSSLLLATMWTASAFGQAEVVERVDCPNANDPEALSTGCIITVTGNLNKALGETTESIVTVEPKSGRLENALSAISRPATISQVRCPLGQPDQPGRDLARTWRQRVFTGGIDPRRRSAS